MAPNVFAPWLEINSSNLFGFQSFRHAGAAAAPGMMHARAGFVSGFNRIKSNPPETEELLSRHESTFSWTTASRAVAGGLLVSIRASSQDEESGRAESRE